MQDFKREEKKKEELRIHPFSEEEGKECLSCHCINKIEAKFCRECGHSLDGKKVCPSCSAKISANVYICEFCGEWLLEGKCRFCLADIEEGQIFCAECGNLLQSIACPECGQLSDFEFCPNCGIPLTPKAKDVFNNIKRKNEAAEVKTETDLFKESALEKEQGETEKSSLEKIELMKMRNFNEELEKKKAKEFTPLFSDKQRESIKSFMDKINEGEIKKQDEEKKKEEGKDALMSLKNIDEIMKEEIKKVHQLKKKAKLREKANGTIYIQQKEVEIIVKDDNRVLDDAYWLWINDTKIGYVACEKGGQIAFNVVLSEGINKVELRLDRERGWGTYASINILPGNKKVMFGGSMNHTWMVVVNPAEG